MQKEKCFQTLTTVFSLMPNSVQEAKNKSHRLMPKFTLADLRQLSGLRGESKGEDTVT
jgi:hypothetical protein